MMDFYIVYQKVAVKLVNVIELADLPDRPYFLFYQKLRSNTNIFKKTRIKKHFIVSEATDIDALAYF